MTSCCEGAKTHSEPFFKLKFEIELFIKQNVLLSKNDLFFLLNCIKRERKINDKREKRHAGPPPGSAFITASRDLHVANTT